AEDTAVPRLDHDLMLLGDADPGELVERRLRAVVVDEDPLDERRRGTARADRLEVALHGVDSTSHLLVGVGQDLGAHADGPPLEMSVPTDSPVATFVMFSGWLRSNPMIGRSFSIARLTAAASITLSWSRRRSAYSRRAYRWAPSF